jgi:hypothetical protein
MLQTDLALRTRRMTNHMPLNNLASFIDQELGTIGLT